MLKTTVISFGLFLSSLAYGADSLAVKSEPPIRYFYDDGSRIPQQRIKIVHDKDTDPNGWRYRVDEWMRLDIHPRYYKHPVHGSNHGWEYA